MCGKGLINNAKQYHALKENSEVVCVDARVIQTLSINKICKKMNIVKEALDGEGTLNECRRWW